MKISVKERAKSVLTYKKPAFWIIIVAVVTCIVTAVFLLTNPYSDDKTADAKESFDSHPANNAPENDTGLHFKTGTWTTSEGTNYVFYENGKDGKTVHVFDGVGLGFEYELDAEGKGVFHMGSADNITKVTVGFFDGGDDTAAINWEDGSRSVLMFVSEDTSDDFAYHYQMGQITK